MTRKLYDEDPAIAVPGATVNVDEPDAALRVKKQDTCFAIFRDTTPQLEDWIQNIPLGPAIRLTDTIMLTLVQALWVSFDMTFISVSRAAAPIDASL